MSCSVRTVSSVPARMGLAGAGPRPGRRPPGDRPADGPGVASEPVFTGLTVDGRTVSGRIAAIGPIGITLAGAEGAGRRLPFRSLVKLTRDPRQPLPLTAEGSHVLFPDGDRLMAGHRRGDDGDDAGGPVLLGPRQADHPARQRARAWS